MNEADLRIAFKRDTGYYPCWNIKIQKFSNGEERLLQKEGDLKGKLRSIYGRWLENRLGNPNITRSSFQTETGISSPVLESQTGFYYRRDYRNWLEEKACNESY